MSCAFLLAIGLLLNLHGGSLYPDGIPPSEGTPFPKNLSVSMSLPETAEIGESVSGEFIIKNLGTEAIPAQGSVDDFLETAMMRLQVEDGKGNILSRDLRKFPFHGGPDIGLKWVQPGESISIPFRLLNFGAIIAPGIYTVTALLSPWAKKPPPDRPIFTSKIRFDLPTPKKAALHIYPLCQKKDDESIWDLLQLRAPALVPALLAEGKAGHPQACIALRNIVGEEGSEALLDLALSRDRKVAKAAALALLYRLPSLADPTKPAVSLGNGFYFVIKPPPWLCDLERDDPQRAQVLKTWQTKFDQPLLSIGRKLLTRVDEPYQYPVSKVLRGFPGPTSSVGYEFGYLRRLLGARRAKHAHQEPVPVWDEYYEYADRMEAASVGALIIGARGGPDQASALLEATRRALRIPMKPRGDLEWGGNTIAPPPLFNLIDSINALCSRGWRTDGKGDAGDQLALCLQLADSWIPKSAEASWHEIVRGALRSSSPVLRQYAVQAIPAPLTGDWEREVRIALEDHDCGVLIAACSAAEWSGRTSLIPPLVQVVGRGGDLETKQTAARVAKKLGARMELWQAWCESMSDRRATERALFELISGTIDLPFKGGPPTYNDRDYVEPELSFTQGTWRTFLEKNRALLQSGKRVPPDDPSIADLLTACPFEIQLKDGAPWPPSIPKGPAE